MYVILRDIAHKLLLPFVFIQKRLATADNYQAPIITGSNFSDLQCEFHPKIIENHKDMN
ncbi:hypothetical protein THF1C08_20434 [Vibrio jasicida]|uniref:Uncharacterized protein n=1 Tax=Vibrio jasicida TaxID=766224 RepID=A0AAU9QN82_9VIBR|nr:hypothetical protein THF1C08_20434 [Vibrio jasicida]CAH1587824.1 hypothetical protein THF1A12_20437 [Vibrio jasicida]